MVTNCLFSYFLPPHCRLNIPGGMWMGFIRKANSSDSAILKWWIHQSSFSETRLLKTVCFLLFLILSHIQGNRETCIHVCGIFYKNPISMILIGFLWQNSSNVETLVDLQKTKDKKLSGLDFCFVCSGEVYKFLSKLKTI